MLLLLLLLLLMMMMMMMIVPHAGCQLANQLVSICLLRRKKSLCFALPSVPKKEPSCR